MKRKLTVLAATGAMLAGGCSAEQVEPPRPVPATVAYDADRTGNRIGVYKYPDPWTKLEGPNKGAYGAFGPGEVALALCQQEGRFLEDADVPEGAPPVRTSTWVRFEGSENGRWAPLPYFELGGAALQPCAEVGLAIPSPQAR